MKRGLIEWDRDELPPTVLERRIGVARAYMADGGLDALVLYTSVARANLVRYFTGYLPYFNRAAYVVPRDGEPVLLCGLSRRVYGWIRATSNLSDIRPAPDLGSAVLELIGEHGWTRVGVVRAGTPLPVLRALEARSAAEVVPADSFRARLRLGQDETEIALRRRAGRLLSETVATVQVRAGMTSGELAAQMDRALRLAGAEDVVLQVGSGMDWPGIPGTTPLAETVRILAQVEYKGHWVQAGRTLPGGHADWFDHLVADLAPESSVRDVVAQAQQLGPLDVRLYETGTGNPFDALALDARVEPGALMAVVGLDRRTGRLHGETFAVREQVLEQLT